MSDARAAYDQLAKGLELAGIKKSNMFGMPTLTLGRKPIGGLSEDGVMFKLPVDSAEMKLALSLSGSHIFAPSMHGKTRVMKQWVIVPVEHQEYYPQFAERAVAFVGSGK